MELTRKNLSLALLDLFAESDDVDIINFANHLSVRRVEEIIELKDFGYDQFKTEWIDHYDGQEAD